MANMIFTNNAATTLASGITNVATSLTVASGTGALFPNPTGGQYFYLTLQTVAGTTIEIVKCTARSTDTLTVTRAQDGTTASAFFTGDKVELRVVNANLANFATLDTLLPVASGGTNSAATPTAGGAGYGTGTAHAYTAAGTAGQFLQSNGVSAPSWETLSAGGALNNIQYFTATATYTPTAGTNFVIVEVVGGGAGGGSGNAGGTSSFGALVSATGGSGATAGTGSSGDLNLTGGAGLTITTTTVGDSNKYTGGSSPFFNSRPAVQTGGLVVTGYGAGGTCGNIPSSSSGTAGAGGGYARKKITSAFSGVTVTIGAGGTAAGTGSTAGQAGIVIVYEYK